MPPSNMSGAHATFRENKRFPKSGTAEVKAADTATNKVPSSSLEGRKDSTISPNDSPRWLKESVNANQSYVSPAQLAKLKSGKRTSIFVGPPDNRYIGIEGAYVNLLTHYSGYAKKKLITEGVSGLTIPDGSKNTVTWIYRYMLAGEKDPEGETRFEDMNMADLVLLYRHCAVLEYQQLMTKIVDHLRQKLWDCVPNVQSVHNITSFIPELNEPVAHSIARVAVLPLVMDYAPYIQCAEGNGQFKGVFERIVGKMLEKRIASGEHYYNQIRPNRQLAWSNSYYRTVSSNKREEARLSEHAKLADAHSATETKESKKPSGPKKVKANQPATNGIDEGGASTPKPIVRLPAVPNNKSEVYLVPAHPTAEATKHSKHEAHRSSSKDADGEVATATQHPKNVIPPTKAGPSKQQSPPPNWKANATCYSCGLPGHLARECVTNSQGGVARDSPDAKMVTTPATEGNTKKPIAVMQNASKKPARAPRVCYNCGKAGHMARKCTAPRAPHGNVGTSNDVTSTPRARTSSRGKKHSGCAQHEKHSKSKDPIEIAANGEGLKTCDRAVRAGEVTRLGLVI